MDAYPRTKVPKSAAERMAESRARKKGLLPAAPNCSVCGKPLKDSGKGRAFEAGLCFKHWAESSEGKKHLNDSRKLRREHRSGASPFRYFGCLPGEEALPEGPFNRMRLAVSSTYSGKGKKRGTLFIVWSDDLVTAHYNVRQSDVGSVNREDGEEVDRSDLTEMAKNFPALTERITRYGHSDVFLV